MAALFDNCKARTRDPGSHVFVYLNRGYHIFSAAQYKGWTFDLMQKWAAIDTPNYSPLLTHKGFLTNAVGHDSDYLHD